MVQTCEDKKRILFEWFIRLVVRIVWKMATEVHNNAKWFSPFLPFISLAVSTINWNEQETKHKHFLVGQRSYHISLRVFLALRFDVTICTSCICNGSVWNRIGVINWNVHFGRNHRLETVVIWIEKYLNNTCHYQANTNNFRLKS